MSISLPKNVRSLVYLLVSPFLFGFSCIFLLLSLAEERILSVSRSRLFPWRAGFETGFFPPAKTARFNKCNVFRRNETIAWLEWTRCKNLPQQLPFSFPHFSFLFLFCFFFSCFFFYFLLFSFYLFEFDFIYPASLSLSFVVFFPPVFWNWWRWCYIYNLTSYMVSLERVPLIFRYRKSLLR